MYSLQIVWVKSKFHIFTEKLKNLTNSRKHVQKARLIS